MVYAKRHICWRSAQQITLPGNTKKASDVVTGLFLIWYETRLDYGKNGLTIVND